MPSEESERAMQHEVVERGLSKFKGEAWLIEFDEEIDVRDWDGNTTVRTKYFIVSQTTGLGDPETCIFPAEDGGEIISWGKCDGSQKGLVAHEATIKAFIDALEDGGVGRDER